ncbi:hypothetical protein C2845_PM09G04190 [Panicum miliaceum]|uniref:Uncharacterized protein n=1 Tax=Panicum miliaceum TaxID=4540 RepID=A0A3L6RXT7_PANMI|nr:hypothetical protein C2845_PM09G04190 [Panicum miliaceum]
MNSLPGKGPRRSEEAMDAATRSRWRHPWNHPGPAQQQGKRVRALPCPISRRPWWECVMQQGSKWSADYCFAAGWFRKRVGTQNKPNSNRRMQILRLRLAVLLCSYALFSCGSGRGLAWLRTCVEAPATDSSARRGPAAPQEPAERRPAPPFAVPGRQPPPVKATARRPLLAAATPTAPRRGPATPTAP